MKRVMIDELLHWSLVYELPKARDHGGGPAATSSAWSAIERYSELMTLIDASPNRFGVVSDLGEPSDPHPDAEVVGQALIDLADMPLELPMAADIFADWPDEHGLARADAERALDQARGWGIDHVRALITGCAVLNKMPEWLVDYPGHRLATKPNGKPAWFRKRFVVDMITGAEIVREVEGMDGRNHRPHKDAYQKMVLKRQVDFDALTRIEWKLWVDALEWLVIRVSGDLQSHRLVPEIPYRFPWIEENARLTPGERLTAEQT